MKKTFKLVIGYDGSASANAALADLKKAGLPRRAEALVLSAADVFLPAGKELSVPEPLNRTIQRSRAAARSQLSQAESLSKRAKSRIKSMFPGWNVKHASRADSPAWALIKEARAGKADLIVVGAGGHSRLGRFLGSVSQMVLIQAPCSVRVGRASAGAAGRKTRVLIGVDGSSDAAAAVRAASRRHWPPQTKFRLVSVVDPGKSTFLGRPSYVQLYLQDADERTAVEHMLGAHAADFRQGRAGVPGAGRRGRTRPIKPPSYAQLYLRHADRQPAVNHMLETFAADLREDGADVATAVRTGDPKHVLLKEAMDWKADCVFVGARGLTHLKRLVLGGVSTAVAARADCSVEVIRVAP